MYICIYVYMYICIVCIYVYMYICIYVYMYICICIYVYMLYICIYVYMYICIYVYMYICYICIYVYMYICIYVYMYICIYVIYNIFSPESRAAALTTYAGYDAMFARSLLLLALILGASLSGLSELHSPAAGAALSQKVLRTDDSGWLNRLRNVTAQRHIVVPTASGCHPL